MCKRILQIMLWIVLLCACTQSAAETSDAPTSPQYRALLVACDHFVSFADTYPSGHHNLRAMESLLRADVRGFQIRRQDGITQSAAALAQAISSAFADATPQDISYLYVSTHGDFQPMLNNPEGELLLSDGSTEIRIGAQELQAMLDAVPGEKVLIIDACNSGAIIGKGISPNANPERMMPTFQGDKYHALVSSGGSEQSWYWNIVSTGKAPLGSSYFTMALADGAGLYGTPTADHNRDGTITMSEMYDYLYVNHTASTPQMYPQTDDFPLFVYDINVAATPSMQSTMTGIVFENTVLTAMRPSLTFEFSVSQTTKLGYQLVYLQDGRWDWERATIWMDTEESLQQGTPDGTIEPGRKQRSITLTQSDPADWGYAQLHLIVYTEDGPRICASRILSIQPMVGDPRLTLRLQDTFQQDTGREMRIFVGHTLPCTLTLTVADEKDETVRRLSVSRPTRPQSLSPEGSLFYWDGLDVQGQAVPAGIYTIKASTRIGGIAYTQEKSFTVR